MAKVDVDFIKWFGHSTFSFLDKATGKKIYYVDPFEFKAAPKEKASAEQGFPQAFAGKQKADIVFITHAHYDHWSPADLKQVLGPSTIVCIVNGCEGHGLPKERVVKIEPNKSYTVQSIKFRTIPAYNIKPERLNYHPRSNNWVGYIFELNGLKIYHAGDTDFVPEMKKLGKIDIAMLPIGGTYTMDVNEAIEAANTIKAEITIPIHYRRLLKEEARDAEERLKSGVKGKVVVMKEL